MTTDTNNSVESNVGGMVADAAPTVIDAAGVRESLERLRTWLEREDFAGIEPHDALTSPLLSRKLFGRSRFLRLASLQLLRRVPLNLRPMLGIRGRQNAISLGWALKAYVELDDERARRRIEPTIARLKELACGGYSGIAWGYYFDWQTRTDFKPADHPIIVSTAFIGEALLDLHEKKNFPGALEMARSACDFILRDLNRTPGARGFCFSYSPTDHEQVYNASILGAALLARVGAITGERELIDTARQAIEYVIDGQAADGSWGYARGDHRSFIDNFHTGYVLCALKRYMEASGDRSVAENLERGWEFYRANFLVEEQIPKYYHNKLYPIDAHAVSQTIVTMIEFGDVQSAARVAAWSIPRMQMPDGYFIYQIHRRFINRIPYLRWSNAWMLYTLALLARTLEGNNGPAAEPGGGNR